MAGAVAACEGDCFVNICRESHAVPAEGPLRSLPLKETVSRYGKILAKLNSGRAEELWMACNRY